MKSELYDEFTGLDLRRIDALADQKSQRVASNVYFTSGKKVRTRPGTSLQFTLPEETLGLYAASGVLRSIAPDGDAAIFNRQRPNLFFDFYDSAGGVAEEFINAERFGSSITAGVQPYGVIRRNGELEHHWFRDRPDTAGDTVSNRVNVPFDPTGMVIKTAEKLWAPDQANGAVRFTSTQFGPSDWTTNEDAGFLPVLANTPGDHTITGLGILQSTAGAVNRRQNALVVFFEDGVQIWGVDPDPLNHYLTGILDGPGTENYRSIANVLGDPFFFSRRGFRSLRLSTRTGAMDAYDIGDKIDALTDRIQPLEINDSIWWERLGCYLCAVGPTIYCLRYDPIGKMLAWSTWEMPFSITDFVDFKGDLWARDTEHRVWRFDEDLDTDDGVPFSYAFESQFHHIKTPGTFKTFQTASVYQQGSSLMSYRPDPTASGLLVPVYQTTGVTRPHEKLPIPAIAESVALRFEGQGNWQLDGYSLDYQPSGI